MTPYKQRRSTHLYSDNTGISTFGGETTASTTELFPTKWSEEEKRNSSILDAEIVSSSPLRSKNNGQMDLLFGLDLDVYEEESLTPHHNKNSSKNSRRLFRVDSASAGHARSQAQTHLFRRDNSLFPTTQERGNQKNTGTGTGTRSSTSTNTSTNESLVSSSLELSHTSSPSTSLSLSPASSLCSNSKYNPSLPLPLPPVTAAATVAGGRKRSSVERRLGSSAFGPSSLTPARTTATTTPMIQSPHCLSPNSFLTMDGRFVQSKNPFSSPMVTDSNNTLTPNSTPAPSSLHHQQYYGTCTGTAGRHFQYPSAAPSFPLLLQSNGMNSSHTNGNKSQQHPSSMECQSGANPSSIISNTSRRSFLPPRSQFHPSWSSHHNNDTPVTEATAGLRAVSIAAPQQQRPTTKASPPSPSTKMISTPRYFCVGPCSPIPEDQSPTLHHHSQHPTTYLSSSPENTMMECTDVASAGSLHKVRRIHRSDDVVSATGYHLTHSYQGSSSIDQQRPIVDSNLNLDPMEDDDEEDRKFDRVSPTDVTQFFPTLPSMKNAPNPPPTPIKQRPSHQPYSNNNTNNSCDYSSFYQRPRLLPRTPGPPLLERKNNAALRTPHPWSTIHSGHDDEFEEQDEQGRMDSVAHHFANSNSRFHTDFDVIGELGRGSFGNVFKVLSRLDGCMYAVKKAHRQAKGEADRDRMLKEVRLEE